jgi:8-oxo-dGTP pyrophosphatase MutT (NUDIX family)
MQALGTGRSMWPRGEFEPGHFTASGFVLSPDGCSVLLILHGKLGRWLQPGGHFEVGDVSVEAAARREIAEETGVTEVERVSSGLIRIDAHEIPAHGSEPPHVHIDLGVGFRALDPTIGPVSEVADARWVQFTDLSLHGVDQAVAGGVDRLRHLMSAED